MRLAEYRVYLLVVGGGLASLCLICLGFAFFLQPLSGDLTRLGGYAEHQFGWNGDKLRYKPPLVAAGSLNRSYDVVAVGDSFTLPVELTPDSLPDERNHWTDYFAAKSGLTVGAFNRDRISVETFLSSASFLDTPPRLLVVEYAERTLQWVSMSQNPQCVTLGPTNRLPLTLTPKTQQPVRYKRDHSHGMSTERIDEAIDFITKNVPRWLLGVNTTPVTKYVLSQRGLFTNKNDNEFLVFDDDLVKATLSDDYLKSVSCYFTQLQRRVEANQKTRFVLMVAPDRTTAYREYLPTLHLPNMAERFAQIEGLNLLRLDQVMKTLISLGIKDVYYPSDTHWGPPGMTAAAEALLRFTVPSARLTQNP